MSGETDHMADTDADAAGAAKSAGAGNAVDPRLLEILVCPVTRGPLVYDREAGELVSKKAKLAYPVRDGVPVMLPDEARRLED